MPIDLDKVVGKELGPLQQTWTEKDVILYHLGLGAGDPPTDPKELAYVYEGCLKVLPTFGVIPAGEIVRRITEVPGLEFNPMLALHGEQEIECTGPLPVAADSTTTGRIAAVYDKRKAAVLVVEASTADEKGKRLFTNRFSIFLRGEGGFGGPSGPAGENRSPDRPPDHVFETRTLPQLALIYRLSGDNNPLHADPQFAQMAGFDRPILHGLCSFGIACRSIVEGCLDGDVGRLARYQARFRGVVFPGETIRTCVWREGKTLAVAAEAKERSAAVLSNAIIELHEG